jgi:hypothetical protein
MIGLRVGDVRCGMCGAAPRQNCTGPGEGWHLARFDRLEEIRNGEVIPEPGEDRT